jgi:hypothetical protein
MRTIDYKDGKKYQVYKDIHGNIKGEIPQQPKHLRKTPTNFQPGYSSNGGRIDR